MWRRTYVPFRSIRASAVPVVRKAYILSSNKEIVGWVQLQKNLSEKVHRHLFFYSICKLIKDNFLYSLTF